MQHTHDYALENHVNNIFFNSYLGRSTALHSKSSSEPRGPRPAQEGATLLWVEHDLGWVEGLVFVRRLSLRPIPNPTPHAPAYFTAVQFSNCAVRPIPLVMPWNLRLSGQPFVVVSSRKDPPVTGIAPRSPLKVYSITEPPASSVSLTIV